MTCLNEFCTLINNLIQKQKKYNRAMEKIEKDKAKKE